MLLGSRFPTAQPRASNCSDSSMAIQRPDLLLALRYTTLRTYRTCHHCLREVAGCWSKEPPTKEAAFHLAAHETEPHPAPIISNLLSSLPLCPPLCIGQLPHSDTPSVALYRVLPTAPCSVIDTQKSLRQIKGRTGMSSFLPVQFPNHRLPSAHILVLYIPDHVLDVLHTSSNSSLLVAASSLPRPS